MRTAAVASRGLSSVSRTYQQRLHVPSAVRALHSSSPAHTDVDPHFARERAKHRELNKEYSHSIDTIGRSQSLDGATTMRDRNRHRIPKELLTFDENGQLIGREHASGFSVPHTPDPRQHVDGDGNSPRFAHVEATEHGAVYHEGTHMDAPKPLSPEEALRIVEEALESGDSHIPAYGKMPGAKSSGPGAAKA